MKNDNFAVIFKFLEIQQTKMNLFCVRITKFLNKLYYAMYEKMMIFKFYLFAFSNHYYYNNIIWINNISKWMKDKTRCLF